MVTMPKIAAPKHIPVPINWTTSTARTASSRPLSAIFIRLTAPNNAVMTIAVPGLFIAIKSITRFPIRTCAGARLVCRRQATSLAYVALPDRRPARAGQALPRGDAGCRERSRGRAATLTFPAEAAVLLRAFEGVAPARASVDPHATAYDPPHACRQAALPKLFSDLFHTLRDLLWRCLRPQLRPQRSYPDGQVQVCLAPAANTGPVQASPWEMALRTNGHGDGRLDTRLSGWRLNCKSQPDRAHLRFCLTNKSQRYSLDTEKSIFLSLEVRLTPE